MLFKISPKVQNNNKKNNVWRIKKIINHYNLGMEDLLVTKSSNLRKKGSGRARKTKNEIWKYSIGWFSWNCKKILWNNKQTTKI
ncbi:hypothetical protein RRG40_04580 [Mycoplasmopsis felis]|uniref:hypothetical protein n=1 Tax=Mycoplasmopsis felis TaxID=33923 RepID=UPI002AFE2A59|nr:hypothetical protein [Mycoplasmopsis felis]WQQ05471.1 hypothetical protein RRG59_03945 [Mycoplasmopsis felis]